MVFINVFINSVTPHNSSRGIVDGCIGVTRDLDVKRTEDLCDSSIGYTNKHHMRLRMHCTTLVVE